MEMVMAPTFTRRRVDHSEAPVPLAFVFDGSPVQPKHLVTVVDWTATARQVLRDLDDALGRQEPRKSLPVVSLRGRLEVGVVGNLRLDRRLGIWTQPRTILWAACPPAEAGKQVAEAVLGWLVDDVPADPPDCGELVQRLRQLHRDGDLVAASRRTAQVFSWEQNRAGTAKLSQENPYGYSDLADFVVRSLEGKEILPGLGGLRRIAAGELDANQAELMTEPIENSSTLFSLVVRVRVVTFPGRTMPVVILDLSRRIWSRVLKRTSVKHLSAYAFPQAFTTALRFTLTRQRARSEHERSYYEPDDDFAPIARTFGLPMDVSGAEIAEHGYRQSACPLLVTHKYGVGERVEAKHGVPDLDKMAAFRRAADILAPFGLLPWQGLVEVLSPTRAATDRDQKWRERDRDEAHRAAFRRWQAEARENIATCYADSHNMVVGYHPSCHRDAARARQSLLELLGDRVRVVLIPLPDGVHGPRAVLSRPASERPTNGDYAELRMQAWSAFITEVRRYQLEAATQIDGILVIAPEWYGDTPTHDDPVNKRAGRITLAKGLRVPVQYLRPEREDSHKARRGDQDHAERFENRVIMAWLDLAWKNIGRIRTRRLKEAAQKIHPGASVSPDAQCLPDRVLALGVLRRNKTRLTNERSFVPFAIELDTDLGTCSARFAREQGSRFEITASLPLAGAIVELASSRPIQLSTARDKRTEQLAERSQAFFHEVITDFCRRAARPLVLIDAIACRGIWPWVADRSLDPENVLIAGHPHAEVDWGEVSIVRVRAQNAPKVLFDRCFQGECQETGEAIRYDAPGWSEAQLFKLTDARADVYLSFGSLIRTLIRGVSCYRAIEGLKQNSGSPRTFSRTTRKPYTGAWSTPNAVEITVVRTASGTNADEVAKLVEWLRTLCQHIGDWTVKPAPLQFETALKDYLADYDFDEDDGEGSDGAAE